MLPPKASSVNRMKYKFSEMKPLEDYVIGKSYNHARSIYRCAKTRGYSATIRTVGKEIRVYITAVRLINE